jgi:hypothetical protein
VSLLVAIITVALLVAVMLVLSAPLRATRAHGELVSPERGELEAAREAKYREIRDAELDYRTGKLSREDFEALDGTLRAEALEILNRLEALEDGRLARTGEDAERSEADAEGARGGETGSSAAEPVGDGGAPGD